MTESVRKKRRRSQPPAALLRLRTIAAIRPEFAHLRSIEDIAETGARLALAHVDAQAASVFLFDQVGRLKRTALVGQDKHGKHLSNTSLGAEAHYPGESFTGKAIPPQDDSPFGAAQWSNTLADRLDISRKTWKGYAEVLGQLRAAVAVPLNGRHRSFGALEVINKTTASQPTFHIEDVHWLSLIAIELALAISSRRRLQRANVLQALAEGVVSMFDSAIEERALYSTVAQSLTDQLLPYRVCIIRLREGPDLSTVAAASSEVSLSERDESPLPATHGLAGKVFAHGEPLYISNIADRDPLADGLRNWNWAVKNKLVSYTCYPLLVDDDVIGTISFYFGFHYAIDEDEDAYLRTLARFLAAFCNGRRVLEDIQEFAREDAMDEARAQYDSRLVPSRHDIADFLKTLSVAFRELKGVNLATSAGEREHQKISAMIEEKLKKVQEEYSVGAKPEIVDLNDLVRQVVSQKKKLPMKTYVDYHLRLGRHIPPLMARSDALRFVVKDLVSNAIKSIQRKDEGYGVITISTGLTAERGGVESIELTVSDTGEGVPKEKWEEVFEAGVSLSGGTGMGLHLARSVLSSSYGGQIEIMSSTVGEGSTFRVTIPTWNSA